MGGFMTGFTQGAADAKKKLNQQQPDMSYGAQQSGGGFSGLAGGSGSVASGGVSNAAGAAGSVGSAVAAQNTQPINTQQQQHGFHGVIPMISGYIQNHQAKQQDALAQTHIQALQDPNTTPEQRQYHISHLQQLYKGRPQVLQQMGISVPGGYNVPSIQPAAQPGAATPGGK